MSDKEKIRNLPLDELVKYCSIFLRKDKKRYKDNLNYYLKQVVNSDKSEQEKQRIKSRLQHEYWRNFLLNELFNRINHQRAIIAFLDGLDEAKKQMKLTGKSEFSLIYFSQTEDVHVI